jgi:hypothetical protein
MDTQATTIGIRRHRFRPELASPQERGMSLQAVVDSLNPVIMGWGNNFADGRVAELFEGLDQWIRMRAQLQAKARRQAGSELAGAHRGAGAMGLVSLVFLRKRRLSPAVGRGLG